MVRCESLLKYIISYIGYEDIISYGGKVIDFSGLWDRITVAEAFKKYASISVELALSSGNYEKVMCLEIEPNLGNSKPVFLYDYPVSLCSFAKLNSYNPLVAERFELYCAGIELCNAFSELTNPSEQKERFIKQEKQRRKLGKPMYPIHKQKYFLKAMKDMPYSSGSAMGVDRLVMFFTDVKKIDQVVTFIPEEL